MFWRWGVGRVMEGYLVYLAYPWMSSKWGLWTARVFQALCLRHGTCKSAVSSFHSCRSMPLAWGFQPWHGLLPSALCLYHGACKSALPAFTPSVHAFGMVLSNLHMAALTLSALCLCYGAFHTVHGLTLLMRACYWMHATCQQPRQITHIQLSRLS